MPNFQSQMFTKEDIKHLELCSPEILHAGDSFKIIAFRERWRGGRKDGGMEREKERGR